MRIPIASKLSILLPIALAASCGESNPIPDDPSGATAGSGGSAGSTSQASSTGAGGHEDPSLVETALGPVQGILEGETRAFLGIPYAAPPIGELRWRPPQSPTPWTAPRDATVKGATCPQVDVKTYKLIEGSDEDCLNLNVWAPKNAPASPAPVFVWIHGGSLTSGSGGEIAYDGKNLSEATGAVVVTLNYRLGALGFLSHAALAAEDPAHPSSGMYGLEDQRAALAWVKANIAAFGGDPARVMLFGESAGGVSTCMHMVSPQSQGLFQRAALESGACILGGDFTKSSSEAKGASVASALGCDDPGGVLSCLRDKPMSDILLTPSLVSLSYSFNIDGHNLPDYPLKLIAAGAFAKVPVIIGANKDEGTLFFLGGGKITTEAAFVALFDALYAGHGKAILAKYPAEDHGSLHDAAIAALGDGGLVCPARATARAFSKAGASTYLYHFVRAPETPLLPDAGAFHSAEIPFLFNNPHLGIVLTPADQQLSKSMIGYWSRLSASGDPNGDGALAWPKYAEASDQHIVLDLTLATGAGLKKGLCDFWDGLKL